MVAGPSVVHRALDGRRYRLTSSLDLSAPCTSVVEVSAGARVHELTAGVAALGEELAAAAGASLEEELSYQGGRLRLGRASRYDPAVRLSETVLVAVWQGRQYCLVTQLYGGSPADVLALLRRLPITEHDDGIALGTGAGVRLSRPASVLKQVPGLGLLEITQLTPELARTLPRWRGVSTAAGELFRDELGDGTPYFVLAGRDTWATVVPVAGGDGRAAERVPAMAELLELAAVG